MSQNCSTLCLLFKGNYMYYLSNSCIYMTSKYFQIKDLKHIIRDQRPRLVFFFVIENMTLFLKNKITVNTWYKANEATIIWQRNTQHRVFGGCLNLFGQLNNIIFNMLSWVVFLFNAKKFIAGQIEESLSVIATNWSLRHTPDVALWRCLQLCLNKRFSLLYIFLWQLW